MARSTTWTSLGLQVLRLCLYLQQPPAHIAPHSGHHPGVGVGARPTRHNNTTVPSTNHTNQRAALRGWAPSRLAPPLPPKMILSRPGVVRLDHRRRHSRACTWAFVRAVIPSPWCFWVLYCPWGASASATAFPGTLASADCTGVFVVC
jgi:hypothetical protein